MKQTYSLILLTLSFFLTSITLSFGQWRQSEYDANLAVRKMTYFKNRLFVAASREGIYYSDDKGETWQNVQENLDEYVEDFAFNDNRIFASGHEHISYSDDKGESWQEVNLPRGTRRITTLVAQHDTLYGQSERGEIFESIDNGESWESLGILEPDESDNREKMAFFQGDLWVSRRNGMYRYSNKVWTRELEQNFHIRDILAYNDKLFIAYCNSGAGLSVYEGNQWTKLEGCLDLVERDGERIIMGQSGSLYFTGDDYDNDRDNNNHLSIYGDYDRQPTNFAAPIHDLITAEGTWFMTNSTGLYKSEDRGVSWQRIDNDLTKHYQATHVTSFQTEVIVGRNGGGFFLSSPDNGTSFERILYNEPWQEMYAVENTPYGLVATGWQKVKVAETIENIKSDWLEGDNFRNTGRGNIIVGLEDRILVGTDQKGIITSKDGGETWQESNEGVDSEDANIQRIHQHTNGDLYFTTWPSYQIYRSTNRGETWQKVNFPTYTYQPVAFASVGNRLFITNDEGAIQYTDNDGRRWERISLVKFNNFQDECCFRNLYAFDENLIAVSRGNGNQLMHLSKDRGETWEDISKGIIFNRNGRTIRPGIGNMYASGENLIVTTHEHGIWYRPLAEMGITPVKPIISAISTSTTSAGETITITGDNFNAQRYWDNTVAFNGKLGKVVSGTKTRLEVEVPGGVSGNVVVSVGVRNVETQATGMLSIPTPRITDFSPKLVNVGDTITIIGENFDANPQLNQVQIGSENLTVTEASETELNVIVSEALRGFIPSFITVTTRSVSFTYPIKVEFKPPVLRSISQESAAPLTENILITAQGLSPTNTKNEVLFGDIEASLTIEDGRPNDSTLSVIVPERARGEVEIKVRIGQSLSEGIPFTVIGGPVIEDFTPRQGVVGDTVTIVGSGFTTENTTGSTLNVAFGSEDAQVVEVTEEHLLVRIPNNVLGSVPINIAVGNVSTQTEENFTIVPGFITLTTPVGGEYYAPGVTLPVRFNTNLTGNIIVRLLKGGAEVAELTSNFPVNQPFDWEIPITIPVGDDYRIQVVNVEDPTVFNNSRDDFQIGANPSFTWNTPTPLTVNSGQRPTPELQLITDADTLLQSVQIEYHPIRNQGQSNMTDLQLSTGNFYSYTVPANAVDELGVRYRFKATPRSGNPSFSDWHTIRTRYPEGIALDYNNFGSAPENYTMFSVPLVLDSLGLAANYRDDFGEYVNTQWRVFTYNSISDTLNNEAVGTNQALVPGIGYWLISLGKESETAPIFSGPGLAVEATLEEPFSTAINPGFNLIGNPYPFPITWQGLQSVNPELSLGQFQGYNAGFTNVNTLGVGESAFVYVDNLSTTATLTFPLNEAGNGRIAAFLSAEAPLDAAEWVVNLELQSGGLNNRLAGVGMHPEAAEGKDRFDQFAAPKFIEYLQATFSSEGITKQFVPTQQEYTWEFTVESNTQQPSIVLRWENAFFGDNHIKALFLEDVATSRVIDMSLQKNYRFSNETRKFKLHFGERTVLQQNLQPSRWTVYEPYPVPFTTQLHFPIALPEAGEVVLELYDVQGKQVGRQTVQYAEGGYREILLGEGLQSKLTRGLYLYRIGYQGQWISGKVKRE